MLTFFRQIRKGLLGEGATSKYLLYAVGEILLVMIGILLALQVNNWNTDRIARDAEQSMLIGIKTSLQSDLNNAIGDNIQFAKNLVKLTNNILHEFESGEMGSDTINYGELAIPRTFDPNTISHEILQSKGVDMIKNQELRYSIINIYNLEYEQTRRFFENELHNLREIYRPILRKWFDIPPLADPASTGSNHYISIDYSTMLKDRELKNAITISHNINRMMDNGLQRLEKEVESLIQDIEKELQSF